MTTAPSDLKTVQRYMQAATGLPWDSLGITHQTPQGGGYHEGLDLLARANRAPGQRWTDYSWAESTRDRAGLDDDASAFDQGDFTVTYLGAHKDLDGWTRHLVQACKAGEAWTRDVREVIYRDPSNHLRILRWDRLGRRTDGDSSHETHTHVSFFRDHGDLAADDNFLGGIKRYMEPGMTPSVEEDDEMPVEVERNLPVRIGGVPAEKSIPPVNVGGNDWGKAFARIVTDASRLGPVSYRVAWCNASGTFSPAGSELDPSGKAEWGRVNLTAKRPVWTAEPPEGTVGMVIDRLPTGSLADDNRDRCVSITIEYAKRVPAGG